MGISILNSNIILSILIYALQFLIDVAWYLGHICSFHTYNVYIDEREYVYYGREYLCPVLNGMYMNLFDEKDDCG